MQHYYTTAWPLLLLQLLQLLLVLGIAMTSRTSGARAAVRHNDSAAAAAAAAESASVKGRPHVRCAARCCAALVKNTRRFFQRSTATRSAAYV